jgi:hypothetical protein
MNPKIRPEHLARLAIIYIRQSSFDGVIILIRSGRDR